GPGVSGVQFRQFIESGERFIEGGLLVIAFGRFGLAAICLREGGPDGLLRGSELGSLGHLRDRLIPLLAFNRGSAGGKRIVQFLLLGLLCFFFLGRLVVILVGVAAALG